MRLLLIFLLAVGLGQAAETLRLSAVVAPDSPDATPMTYQSADGPQKVWVSNKPIITEKDVKTAHLSLFQPKTLDVSLTEKGADAMIAATSAMRPGTDRIAIVVEGKLHSAPVLSSVPLGAAFIIEGLVAYDDLQIRNLGRAIMGQPPLPAGKPEAGPPPPKPVPYTEAEIQAIKKQREGMGIHQLDRLPDQAELDKTLRQGMTAEDVIAVFGKPTRHNRKPDSKDFYLAYEIAPERRPDRSNGEMGPEGFKVEFGEGKVVSWRFDLWSSASREMKTWNPAPGLLRVVFPKIDLAAEDADLVAWVEGIRIADLNQPVTATDLLSLLSLVYSFTPLIGDNKDDTIRADCDVLRLLSRHLPEIAKLTAAAKDGKITRQDLRAAVAEFCTGDRPVPEPKHPAGR